MCPKRLIFGVVTFCLFFACPVSRAQDYLIGSDDVLNITVYREEDMSRKVRVSSDGYISFPLLGKVKVEGFTVPAAEGTLSQGLTKFIKNPQVTVFIEEYGTITVSGQVKNPGTYPLKAQTNVIEAISIAGGFTKIASQNGVKVMRVTNGSKESIVVKVADINKTGDKSKDIPLKRGDIVFVPESLF